MKVVIHYSTEYRLYTYRDTWVISAPSGIGSMRRIIAHSFDDMYKTISKVSYGRNMSLVALGVERWVWNSLVAELATT